MGTNTKKITETIRAIETLKQVLKSSATDSEYQRGMYNGIEMMLSLLCQTKPKIIDKKEIEEN